jgi:hypothetical protein
MIAEARRSSNCEVCQQTKICRFSNDHANSSGWMVGADEGAECPIWVINRRVYYRAARQL